MEEDSLVRLRKHQVYINGHKQSVVGVYWVSDGMDQCLVGYLHRCQVKQVTNPTKLGKEETNYKVLPKLLQMWIHLQPPI